MQHPDSELLNSVKMTESQLDFTQYSGYILEKESFLAYHRWNSLTFLIVFWQENVEAGTSSFRFSKQTQFL